METGLSSLLAFMSTGQCSLTRAFLDDLAATRPNKMHFASLDDCVNIFTAAENRQATLGEGYALKYCNLAIYGTANAWYSLHPTRKVGPNNWVELSIPDKFTPMFGVELGRSYMALLGALSHQDPATSDAPKIPWEDVIRWILGTELSSFGFGSGLAPCHESPGFYFFARRVHMDTDAS
jgi:hypothetical protein